ncbi:hypothetical protein MtrunA17_Chr3g0122621 [Medicago truncatula]|uniref:Transmembrane protein, putative n=1 Tax=Medicago truncatula TaxID=3880 RepID=G7JC04_MEDTR|nr:transmembrane protein, putative [Medicago truncatula]RHN69247.1 hypothetical protein MtrunA17_Chr3g0122621 [Medicago truncatula]
MIFIYILCADGFFSFWLFWMKLDTSCPSEKMCSQDLSKSQTLLVHMPHENGFEVFEGYCLTDRGQ